MDIPLIGLGTYDLRGVECTKVVREALELGYRHFDTAYVYENHRALGKGIKGFDRDKLFLTSKITLEQVHPKKISASTEKACNAALKEIGTDYLDLYLIHWPDPPELIVDVFKAMETLVSSGKVRHAGVSNFTIHHLQDLSREGCLPFANQVEFHPYLYQKALLNYCRLHNIELVAYRPFGKGKLLTEPLLKKIGLKHGKTSAQVILRWLMEHQIPTIPKASSVHHLKENFDIFDFKLSSDEIQQLNQLHHNQRFCKADSPVFEY
jgi:2,5-diketo-D-gluconate reductase B